MWQLAPIFRTLLRRKLGVFLLVVQIALTVTIFSNLAFFSQLVKRMMDEPSGIDDTQIFAVTLRPLNTLINYADAQRDMRDIQALPGVESVAATHWVPLGRMSFTINFRTQVEKQPGTEFYAATSEVSQRMLATMGLRIIEGRDFTEEDMVIQKAPGDSTAKNIIVSRAFADILFGEGKSAVGKRIYDGDAVREIVGVTANWIGFTIPFNDRLERTVFFPGYNESDTEHRYLVRAATPQDRAAVIEGVNQVLSRNYHNELLSWVENIDEAKAIYNSQNVATYHLFLVLMITLGFVIAFAISGQTLFWATQRTKQIGIRRALGASRRLIIGELLVENAMICGLGLSIGILLALAVNQVVVENAQLLPMPPLFLLGICLLLLAVCLTSAGVPAWRASKISPSLATRSI